MATRVFITGITGYIGGEVYAQVIKSGRKLDIHALVRSDEKAALLRQLDVTPVLGGLNDTEVIKAEVAAADVILHTADADHESAVHAIVEALGNKQSGKKPLFLHTSGTGIFMDLGTKNLGDVEIDTVTADDETEKLEAIPESQPHRVVDMFLLKNASDTSQLAIIAPCTIYGVASDAHGLSNVNSAQLPTLISHSIRTGKVRQIGKGLNKWSQIHIKDLGRFYATLVTLYLDDKPIPTGYLFPENGEFFWGELAKAVASALAQMGLATDKVYEARTDEEVEEAYTSVRAKYYIGTTSRVRGPKSRSIWTPVEEDIISSVPAECADIKAKMDKRIGKFRFIY